MTRRVRHSATSRAIISVLSAIALLAASGCGLLDGSSDAPAAGSGSGQVETAKITLGVLPVLDVAPVHIALRKGYFKAEGLEVELKVIQGGAAAIPGLVSEELDMTFGNWVSFFAAEAQGMAEAVDGLRLVSDGYQAKPEMFVIVTGANSPIKSPKDLAGKTIAVNTFKNIPELTARASLEANDVDPDSVTFKEFPFPDMQAALQNKTIDAAFLVEPFITRAQRAIGAITVLDAATGPTDNIPIAGYGTTGKFARENPKTVAAFQRAMAKGQAEAADRPTVEPLLQDYAKVDKETASLVHFGVYPTTLDATRLQRVSTLMRTYGLLERDFDVKQMLIGGTG